MAIGPSELTHLRLAVLGPGSMGGALVRGWVKAGTLQGINVRFYTTNAAKAAALAAETGAFAASSPADAVTHADILLVSVKPPLVLPSLEAIKEVLPVGVPVLSVAAGIKLEALERILPGGTPVLRVMPNTPALVGEAASAFCRGSHATGAHADLVQTLFSAVGAAVEVSSESQIDAVIGVAGSASAYFYLIIEALTDAGVRAGLPRQTARLLAAQTALGSAKMVLQTGQHPAVLKDAVTTPGGTTIAALHVLEKAGIRGTLMDAVLAAQQRAREMG
ncbi:MAG: pyrroline-5-carboxylate reductase [Cytophagales bacterium]|nr:pyrroline-5-carboxylate reductase [Armatimonadota bacterium]